MDPLASLDIQQVTAENPGPFTLSGTNTWLVGRDPCWVVDPGPALADHLATILAEAAQRGGGGGIALPHAHADPCEALPELARETGAPVAAAAFAGGDLVLAEGD